MKRLGFAALVAVCASASLAFAAASAWASPSYPDAIKSDLNLNSTPPCTICHADNNGGTGTVVKPFGRALMNLGLTAENPSLLAAVLTEAATQNLDSGGDGVPDIQELKDGKDPNTAGAGGAAPTVEQPEYGCATATGRVAPTASPSAALAALVIGWLRRRKRGDP